MTDNICTHIRAVQKLAAIIMLHADMKTRCTVVVQFSYFGSLVGFGNLATNWALHR